MKSKRPALAVTSLPPSPQDEANHRVRRYALTMVIRTACFLLMVLVQPLGWWTWAFAAAAIFLPYVAVVYANAGTDSTVTAVESPARQIEAAPPAPFPTAEGPVLRVDEQHDQRGADDR